MRASKSGRVVVDITPRQKQIIYAALKARGGLTMREWFMRKAVEDGLISPDEFSTSANSSKEVPDA